MKMVTVGPKYFRSQLPVGEVGEEVLKKIDLANEGRLGLQLYAFNMRVGKGETGETGTYVRAYVVNGACRFKKYGLVDKLKYAVGRLFVRKGKNPYNG
jgi:hypothetical protein